MLARDAPSNASGATERVTMYDSDVEPEIFKSAMRDAIIARVNRLGIEDLTDLLGHLILRDRFKSN